MTPQALTVRVLGDPTPLTGDDVRLLGMGIDVLPGVDSVGLSLGWQGTTSCYVNGEFWTSGSATEMESHEWTRLNVVPEPVHLASSAVACLLLLRLQQRTARPDAVSPQL